MQTTNSENSTNNDIYADLQKVKQKAYETRDAISQTAYDVKDRASDLLEQKFADIKDKSADMQENVLAYVQQNPAKTIMFSFLGGLLFSQLLRK